MRTLQASLCLELDILASSLAIRWYVSHLSAYEDNLTQNYPQISIGGYISEDIMCEQPAIYLFNTTSLSWATDYVPNRQFTTPTLLRNLTGGQGSSNSTGGSGWQNPKEVYTATVTKIQAGATNTATQTPELQHEDSNSKLGPMYVVAEYLHLAPRADRKHREQTGRCSWRSHFSFPGPLLDQLLCEAAEKLRTCEMEIPDVPRWCMERG